MSDNSMRNRLKHAWNVFRDKETTSDARYVSGYENTFINLGIGSTRRPDIVKLHVTTERSMVAALYNRIAIDVSAIPIKHVRVDKNGRYINTVDSGLNNCLTVEANKDQTGRDFIMDAVLSMFDEGCVALVPVDTNVNLTSTSSYEILSLRTGKVMEWYPEKVKLEVYNDKKGIKENIVMPKDKVCLVQNPFYSIMNEPNSTLKRLVNKLSLLDEVDEQTSASKLDLIIQLPYAIKSEARKKEAAKRKQQIEEQLRDSTYGIAYIDSTEKVTQLNRSLENNLMEQIKYLTQLLHSQLGVTEEVLAGTADEKVMLNYYNATIEPIISAFANEMIRKFLTKTARTQGQSIKFVRDPFRLVPVNDIADIADKFTRNEILSSNELRSIVGFDPVADAKADELRNKNLNQAVGAEAVYTDDAYGESGELGGMSDDPEALENLSDEELLELIDELDGQLSELDQLQEELDEKEEIAHYASPYYDPVKAHEYYMKNRKLKGRKLNDEGEAVATVVKEKLNEERDSKIKSHKEQTTTKIENLRKQNKSKIEARNRDVKAQIEAIRARLKNINRSGNYNRPIVQQQIDMIRQETADMREELANMLSKDITKLNEEHSTEREKIKKEYDDKYTDELGKIRSEEKYLQPASSSSGSKSSGSSKSSSSSKTTKVSTKEASRQRVQELLAARKKKGK